MEDRNGHALAQPLLDLEALRRLDVLEIDAAEGGLQRCHGVDEAGDVRLGHLDVEDVDVGELLEEHRLALHHRLGGQRPDVAQPQHSRAVGDDAHEIGAGRVFRHQQGIRMDGLGHRRNAWRIGQRHVALVAQRLGGANFQLSRLRFGMVDERARLQVAGHGGRHRELLKPRANDRDLPEFATTRRGRISVLDLAASRDRMIREREKPCLRL